MNPDQTISLQTVNGWAILPSSLKRSDRSPRFHLHFLASLAGDVGAQKADYIGNVFSVGPQLLDDPVFASAAA